MTQRFSSAIQHDVLVRPYDVEFQFGDCCPFLDRPKQLACKQMFGALAWREELEYSLESDTDAYHAPARCRFDDPEFAALFADMLRRLMVNQSVNGALRREGFEKDITAVASVASKHFDDFAHGVLDDKSKLPPPVQQP